jgi:hypothetical protein
MDGNTEKPTNITKCECDCDCHSISDGDAGDGEASTSYIMNIVMGPEGKWVIVMTNSSLPLPLPVFPFKDTSYGFSCPDSHNLVKCSAQMIGTKTSGTERLSLRLTSPMFDAPIVIQVKFDHSCLDMLIDEGTEVLFPLPNQKPIDCGIIMHDEKGYILLTNPSFQLVQTNVLVGDIQMKDIKYQVPKKKDNEKKLLRPTKLFPQKSETPDFVQKDSDSERRCDLPTDCLSVMPCYEGHVPVRCSGKLVWSQTLGSQTLVVLLLFSTWLETPMYVQFNLDPSFLDQFNLDPSFLDQFIRGEIQVFFPMLIPKHLYKVEIKETSNHLSLKGKSGQEKANIRKEQKERRYRGSIGYDDDDPLPVTCYVEKERPNQVWSIFSNKWELIKKPKPRKADWKWNDSTATWVCELDLTNKQDGLKLLDRSKFSNCGF